MTKLELTKEEIELIKTAIRYGQHYLFSKDLVTNVADRKLAIAFNKILTKLN